MAKSKKKLIQKQSTPQYGYIYPILNKCLNFLRYLSLVEGFKYIGKIFAEQGDAQKSINYARFSVDIFITLKWVFIVILLAIKVNNALLVSIVWYLLVTNIYTYFYYHTWSSEILSDSYFDADRIKRRFTTLSLAISYTIFGFAYLYRVPYSNDFSWNNNMPTFFQSLWFSISNSLTANYDQVKPITNFGYSVSMIQLLMMFVFLTIIIGGTIPQPNQSNKEG